MRECRRRLGLKQFAFADLLGTSQSAVSRWEAGAQVPGYGMQNKVRDLLHKPLYNDRADRVLIARARLALGRACLVERDLAQAFASAEMAGDYGGEAAFAAFLRRGPFSQAYHDQVGAVSTRAPLFSEGVVMATFVGIRMRYHPDGSPWRPTYAQAQWTPVRLSSGHWFLRQETYPVPPAEGEALAAQRPRVLTLDGMA